MKAHGHQASFQATLRPAQATASHPKVNIRLRVRNRHIKSARKYMIPGRKQAHVEDIRKSFGEKSRMLASTFFKRILEKTFYTISVSAMLSMIDKLEFRSSGIPFFGSRSVGPPRFGVAAGVISSGLKWTTSFSWASAQISKVLLRMT